MSRSRKMKEEALLKEGEEWEQGKRGSSSIAASREEEESLERQLELEMISLRLPTSVLGALKRMAHAKGLKYQPYLRQILVEHVNGSSLEARVRRLERELVKE